MTPLSFMDRLGPGLAVAGLIFWLNPAGRSIAAASDLDQYDFQAWQSDEGLPDDTVNAIAQTDDGYLWVGTRRGLARFDGVSFMRVDEKAAPELRDGRITALCASTDGSLWIGCTRGLFRLKSRVFSHFTETNGLPGDQVRCVLQDRQGTLWVGTAGGLARYVNGEFTSVTRPNELADMDVMALCEDYYGTLWIATRHGLSRLDQDGKEKDIDLPPEAPGGMLTSVCDDQDGNLWVGSETGLYRLGTRGDRKFYGLKDGLPDIPVNLVYEDREGRVWVGTVGGLACMTDGRVTVRPDREGAFGDSIRAMFEDREGNLWVGAKGGLYRLNSKLFTIYGPPQGLTYDNVTSVCEDKAGAVWVATWGGGLNRLENGTITPCALPGGNGHDLALSLCLSREGGLWVGMADGLYRFKDGRFTRHYSTADGLLDEAVRVIYEDPRGALWIGTRRGLNLMRDGHFESYDTSNGLPGRAVQAICGNTRGDIWIGTDGGLTRWRAGKFTRLATGNGRCADDVDALHEDDGQTLWIGTKGGGLDRLKAGGLTTYTTRQGLFSDDDFDIVEDDFGGLWMSCRRGIFQVRKKELDEYAEGKIHVLTCRRYGKADGLISAQCSDAAKPGGWKGRDWRLWFPTFRGLVAVNTRIRPNDKLEPVVIEKVVADGRTLRQNGSALHEGPSFTAPPGHGELEFHYAMLSYREPEECRYRFKLEGVDPQWVDAGARRVAYYNHLRPGRYRFRVVACNEDGVWNQVGAGVSVALSPHFWQTWWFVGLTGAAAVSGIVVTVRRNEKRKARHALERLEQQHLIERERSRIAKDIHDDLGASLTRMAFLSELVKTDETKEDVDAHAGKIAATARETVSALDEIVWAVNPHSDTLDSLLQYLSHYANKFLEETPVGCRLEIPMDIPSVRVTAEVRHNLFLVVKEALNNVVKHSGATEARLRVILREATLRVEVADNGQGFAADSTVRQKRSGLDNMRQRLEVIGGALEVETRPGSGTRIVAQAPLTGAPFRDSA
ncbi:MAG: hypothetical protein KGJ60_05985 [Verrucomicrobiota bacterium]|nr:hypothetical protein [Verrucomicrobiota bacterium]